jgi:hypothetical protein
MSLYNYNHSIPRAHTRIASIPTIKQLLSLQLPPQIKKIPFSLQITPKSSRLQLSACDIKKQANLIYDSLKKIDPKIRIPELKKYQLPHKISKDVSNNISEYARTDDVIIYEENMAEFEKSLLALYKIKSLYDNIDKPIQNALELCNLKFKMDVDIKELDVEARKSLYERGMLPNRSQLMLLARWVQEKINFIESTEFDSNIKYRKCSYIYFLVLLELSRQVHTDY